MIRHNILIAYPNSLRYKSSFFINLVGLSSGLACTLLIYLWVMDELSIDKFHEKDSHLFQVFQTLGAGADHETIEYTPGILAKTLAEEMPEVESAVAVRPGFNQGILSFYQWHTGPSIPRSIRRGSRCYWAVLYW